MRPIVKILSFLLVFALYSCKNENQKPLSEAERMGYISLGDSISNEMQRVLLQNVGKAIQKGGTEYAVAFCNEQAMPLTDSLSAFHNVKIQRLTDKNRNPNNNIKTSLDSLAWEKIKTDGTDFVKQGENGKVYYYKPIVMGMATCIKCHGSQADISEHTQKTLRLKYPFDKAIGYSQGDLRGMWKIGFEE